MSNLLSGETSPYLLQHAGQPVHWFPWGPAALERARRDDRPILLSIGYSACHWCHVMAHESFDDEATAALMNRLFVNIKVDREERPDLDQIYQTAHQLLTRQGGGWPLTVFLAPDGTPFHSGTYYPPEARHGRPAWRDLLESVAAAWQSQRGAIDQQGEAVRQALARTTPQATASEPAAVLAALGGPLQAVAGAWLAQRHDREHGGFGGAPKFPHATDLAWLLERGVAEGDGDARDIALLTLTRMAQGGLQDQLGGGFFRYSVDERWQIPHFEKMLSDNGLLLGLYAEATALTGDPLHGRAVEDGAGWLMREMQAPEGGYLSSLDADVEGREGRHYVWTSEEVRAALTPLEWDLASAHWDLIAAPNFEARHWHLGVVRPTAQLAATFDQPQAAIDEIITTVRAKLLARREQRLPPGRDDKVLTSWNALAITGMVRAAGLAGRPDWLQSARRAADFIHDHLWIEHQGRHRLLATWKDGQARFDAYLDDHAFLIEAMLALLQADFRLEDLRFAQALADELLDGFEDTAQGGFFFTRHDHERLIHRTKTGRDQALPSGNASAAWALQRLGHLVSEPRYLRAAERTLLLFAAEVAHQPGAWSRLLQAAVEQQCPPALIVLRGPQAREWRDALLQRCLPHTLVLAPPDATTGLPAPLDHPLPAAGGTTAWVCSGTQCLPPVHRLDELLAGLAPAPAPPTGR
ncbi:hypothetical protein C7444_1195 [Sphaerotilus hippei]|uniref:Spermatogenesis-associated protein 20-like TRX domain-containing protein n=1 Tax=Sphaerotilus hippei TaxID=744406 RepID=A0A318GW50_9BURK|nr:thioredoxin domain-containing protein [Sphaerotilus hippei]PXW93496.1 hypothetical protein C7444_1195 [Sphaerotilus hippei]